MELMKLMWVVEAVMWMVTSEVIETTTAVADQTLEAAKVSQASGSESRMNKTGTT
jgi:hypothetical protein